MHSDAPQPSSVPDPSPQASPEPAARPLSGAAAPGAAPAAGPDSTARSLRRPRKCFAGARVGAAPDGSENWNVATCGPGIEIGAGATVKAGAMIYDSVPAGEGGEE